MQINFSTTASATAATASQARSTSAASARPNIAGASTAASSGSSAVAASASSLIVDSTYSDNVGGKTYPANISQSDGTYTLSVPNLPGSSVTGSSLNAAETALNVRIDVLV